MLTRPETAGTITFAEDRARAAFGRLALPANATFILAVSGGGDSVALMHMARRHFADHRPDVRLLAATIDHGLRAESASEVRHVAQTCETLGIEHFTLRWDADRPATGVQTAARQARYALLTELAAQHQSAMVLTGHTEDDRAETVAMRAARAPDGRGLAGIDDATLSARCVWFVRPLLHVGRRDLRHWLTANGLSWIDDPSNDDRRFERVRVRADLARDPLKRDALLATAAQQRERRHRDAFEGAACLDDRAIWQMTGDGSRFTPAGMPPPALTAAMASELAWTGRLPRIADAARAERALAFCRTAPNGAALTIGGCRLHKYGGAVTIAPEPRNRRAAGERCFETLLTSADWPLAEALARLHDGPPFPPPPFTKS
ncbi:MAG: tRNA lysidine(34) synthetase TilS [Phyllobacteriaceae bacterium]|nr:tRNA lysidine(34) synthetase TilS [Phyllobacteriaceae bacterium]